jgi:putative lipoprotein
MLDWLRRPLATAAIVCMAASAGLGSADASQGTLTGSVSYRERMALPPNAVVEVKLVEAPAESGGTKEIIAQTRIESGGQVPIAYKLEFDRDRLKAERTYALQALISVEGKPWFFASTRYPVTDALATVDILVQRITTSADTGGKDAIFGRWQAETIRDSRVANDVKSTLTIGPDGKINGEGGCNTFVGQSKINGDQIAFGDMPRTLKACPAPVMAQEEKFLDALADVRAWRISANAGKLELLGSNGKVVAVLSRL